MTVLAKPSVKRMHGWRAAVPAALVCAIIVTGCGSSGGAASAQGTASRDPAASSPDPGKSASPSACAPWAGLDDLSDVTTWLRQMIGDEVIFGAGTAQAKKDGLAVIVYAESLDGLEADLPPQYARDLRNSVLSVAASPDEKTPEQLNTAANAAQSLAMQISQLCF